MENGENETTIKNLTKDQLLKAYKVSISCAFLWPAEVVHGGPNNKNALLIKKNKLMIFLIT
jgi:hypothetical protein